MMSAYYWCENTEEKKYKLQIDGVPRSRRNVIQRKLKDKWKLVGEGGDSEGKCILLFSGSFGPRQIKKWADNSEWNVINEDEVVKTKEKAKKERKPTTCSICSEIGHNARTCPKKKKKSRKKKVRNVKKNK